MINLACIRTLMSIKLYVAELYHPKDFVQNQQSFPKQPY